MQKTVKNWYALSDPAVLQVLGDFVQQTRLQQNKTQQEVALAAGINRSTMVQLEKGGGTLLSFVQTVRALGQLQVFQQFEITPQISPLQLAKIDQNKRQRASNKKTTKIEKPKSDW